MAGEGKVHFDLSVDHAKAVQGFLRLVEAQKKSTTEAQRTNKPLKEQDDLITGITNRAAGMLLSYQAVASAVRGIVNLVKDWDREMDRVAAKMSTTSDAAISLALQNPGRENEVIGKAITMGARFSVGAGDALKVFDSLQGQLHTFEKAQAAAVSVFQAMQLKVGRQAAVDVATGAAAIGIDPGLGVSTITYGGPKLSKTTPDIMARAAESFPEYENDPALTVAVAARLIEVKGIRRSFEILRAVAKVIRDPSTDPLFTSLGLDPETASIMERLEALATVEGSSDPAKLRRIGISDALGAEGIGVLLSALPGVISNIARLRREVKPGTVGEQVREVQAGADIVGAASALQIAEAQAEIPDILGPTALRATARATSKQQMLRKFRERGMGSFVGTEIGFFDYALGGLMFPEIKQDELTRLHRRGVADQGEEAQLYRMLRGDLTEQMSREDFQDKFGLGEGEVIDVFSAGSDVPARQIRPAEGKLDAMLEVLAQIERNTSTNQQSGMAQTENGDF